MTVPAQDSIAPPIVEADDENADAPPANGGERQAEDAKRHADLKAWIDAESAKTQITVQQAKGGTGATLAAHERDLWVAMERARIAGRDVIPDKPQNEVSQRALRPSSSALHQNYTDRSSLRSIVT